MIEESIVEVYKPTPEECEIIANMATICELSPESLEEWITIFILSDKQERDLKIRWCQLTVSAGKPPYEAIVKEMLANGSSENLQAIQEGVNGELQQLLS